MELNWHDEPRRNCLRKFLSTDLTTFHLFCIPDTRGKEGPLLQVQTCWTRVWTYRDMILKIISLHPWSDVRNVLMYVKIVNSGPSLEVHSSHPSLLRAAICVSLLHETPQSSLMRSDPFSPIAIAKAFVWQVGMIGATDKSMIRRRWIPCTRRRGSTTASGSETGPILHVPTWTA